MRQFTSRMECSPPERSIIEQPELAVYYENFGNGPADNCLVAEVDGKALYTNNFRILLAQIQI